MTFGVREEGQAEMDDKGWVERQLEFYRDALLHLVEEHCVVLDHLYSPSVGLPQANERAFELLVGCGRLVRVEDVELYRLATKEEFLAFQANMKVWDWMSWRSSHPIDGKEGHGTEGR